MVTVPQLGPAAGHARRLLAALGAEVSETVRGDAPVIDVEPSTALADWAASGAMSLTGRAAGPPLAAAGAPASAVRAALVVFDALCRRRGLVPRRLPGPELLAERAAAAGLTRRGPVSAGGAFRPLPTRFGWLGISLPRADDLDLLPALVENTISGDPWAALASWARTRDAASAAVRAQLLGIAAAAIPDTPGCYRDEQRRHRRAAAVITQPGGARLHPARRPRVVDLTSLWAGPLCAHLLGRAGAEVVKVESTRRPDGARSGPREFYDLLHGGHASVALDFTAAAGLAALSGLVRRADVVLETSRPRALYQVGINADEAVAAGATWVSITAYGRTGPWSGRVGFGDDAAAAAGLLAHDNEEPLPCGDAIADPLAGVHAAAAAAAALCSERAWLIDVSMRDVGAAAADHPHEPHEVYPDAGGDWWVQTATGASPVASPSARTATQQAAAPGADTNAVLHRWGLR
jgi:crotonobetainyl-CoA:carnitine CoA-transferase CaiB-like acyl-CoA transferase